MSGRLAAVLARALLDTFCWDRKPDAVAKDAEAIVRAIPEPERDAIEAALDVCAVCGMWPGWGDHDDNPGFRMAVGGSYHPYQPLVAP